MALAENDQGNRSEVLCDGLGFAKFAKLGNARGGLTFDAVAC